jgi:hypothetical protein
MPPINPTLPVPVLEDWRPCGAFAHGVLRYDGWMALVELETATGSAISAICEIQFNRVEYAERTSNHDEWVTLRQHGEKDLAYLTIRWPQELRGREDEIFHKLFRRAVG